VFQLKNALRNKHHTVGSWLTFSSEAPTEIMAQAGFEWLVLDMEHAPLDIATAARLIRIVDLAGLPALCRLPANDATIAKSVLDAGAAGIIVPCIESAEAARQVVASAYYPPHGKRGVGLARAQAYGGGLEAYRDQIADSLVVIVMIETRRGMEAAAEIAAVPGIDGMFIGPYDLSASLGHIGELDHQDVQRAEQNILQAAEDAGVACGLHVVHPDAATLSAAIQRGYTFLAVGVDMIFLREATAAAMKSVASYLSYGVPK
jgi:2-dehydro-3-deoxyglucarate aldolase